jgi:uncharacterized membrane protein YjfL (UPF0719 family)
MCVLTHDQLGQLLRYQLVALLLLLLGYFGANQLPPSYHHTIEDMSTNMTTMTR